jgi:hypothetical protein
VFAELSLEVPKEFAEIIIENREIVEIGVIENEES